uniref:Guanylate cyclase domain-containing protein n=1 Tax=Schistocephalus solidus TaxID=70667 RepID=A0A183TRY2_SCHSO
LRHPLHYPLGTQKGDVYSFAIIAHELFCYSPPFGDCDLALPDILERIRSGMPAFRPTVFYLGSLLPRGVNLVDHMFKLMQKYSAQLETEVQERTVELEEEKQKTEDLIAKMLPLSVAQALVAGKPVDPEAFENVTIYFSDIVGFSLISAKSTPLQTVDLLNDIYSTFDATIEKFDVYKVFPHLFMYLKDIKKFKNIKQYKKI